MKKSYPSLSSLENDILIEQPRLIFLTGKTSNGKTFLSERLAQRGYQIVKLDDVVFHDVMDKYNVIDSNLAFATYMGNAPKEWIDSFVVAARSVIATALKNGNVVVEGALANNEMIDAVFSLELKDFLFVFLLPSNVITYSERITKRFILETESGKTGLPKKFFQMVHESEIQKYREDKKITELLQEQIRSFAKWSLDESERRLQYFREKFKDILVVEV